MLEPGGSRGWSVLACCWLASVGAALPLAAAEEAAEPALLFAIGRLQAQEGRLADARANLERAVELDPDDAYLRVELATLLASAGSWEEATGQVRRARELAPEDPEVIRAFGRLHLYQVRDNPSALDGALQAFEDLRARTPADLESLSSLARIYVGQGRYQEAAEVYEQLLDHWPGNPQAQSALVDTLIRADRKERAEEHLRKFLELTPDATDLRVTLADLLSERGAHEGAVDVLRVAGASEDPELGRRLAVALYRLGEVEEALGYLEGWVDEEPGDTRARYLQSLLLSALGRDGEALVALQELRDRRPGDAEVAALVARFHLQREGWEEVEATVGPFLSDGVQDGEEELALQSATALRALGRPSRALDRLALVASHPEIGPRARASQAEILLESGREAEGEAVLAELGAESLEGLRLAATVYQRLELYGKSVPVLRELRDREPDRSETLFWLGAAYERTRRFRAAEDTFLELLEREPEFAPALNYLGYMWAERGRRLEEALDLVQRAVELEPENGAYVDSLGWALFQLGRTDAAKDQLERAAELIENDPTVLEHLGDVYRKLGREPDAAEAYRRALSAGSDNREAVERKLRELGDGP